MMTGTLLRKGAIVAIVSLPFTLGACATTKSVDEAKAMAAKAQATADQALAAANEANEKADRMFHKSLKK